MVFFSFFRVCGDPAIWEGENEQKEKRPFEKRRRKLQSELPFQAQLQDPDSKSSQCDGNYQKTKFKKDSEKMKLTAEGSRMSLAWPAACQRSEGNSCLSCGLR